MNAAVRWSSLVASASTLCSSAWAGPRSRPMPFTMPRNAARPTTEGAAGAAAPAPRPAGHTTGAPLTGRRRARPAPPPRTTAPHPPAPSCAPDNGGVPLPDGFCAVVVADQVGAPRHLVVTPTGDLFVALESGRMGRGGILALRDTTGDGKADVRESFGTQGGTGIALGRGGLYFSTASTVYRYRMRAAGLMPLGDPDVIVKDLPAGGHSARNLALSADGRWLFVNVGSPSNSCQEKDRSLESPGKDPCPELETRAGVWRVDPSPP